MPDGAIIMIRREIGLLQASASGKFTTRISFVICIHAHLNMNHYCLRMPLKVQQFSPVSKHPGAITYSADGPVAKSCANFVGHCPTVDDSHHFCRLSWCPAAHSEW